MNGLNDDFAAGLRRVLVEKVHTQSRPRRRAYWPWVVGAFAGVTVLGGTSVATGVPFPLGEIFDNKVETAVVDPEERAENDAILNVPLVAEVQEAEGALARHGVPTDFADLVGYTQIDRETGEFLVYYDHTGDQARVDQLLERIQAAASESTTVILPVAAGYSADARRLVAKEILQRDGIAEILGVSAVSAVSVDPSTGQIRVFTPDPIEEGTSVQVGDELVLLVGSTGSAEF